MKGVFNAGAVRIALRSLTALFLAIGLTSWVWTPQANADLEDSPLTADSPTPSALKANAPANISGIVSANIFSSARTPPTRRYNPADYESVDGASVPEMIPTEAVVPQLAPVLFGIVMGGTGAMALMQTDSSGAAAQLFREGDRIGHFRVVKIKPSSVIVSGPAGRTEIQVERNPTGAK